jgi:hypothetical protein
MKKILTTCAKSKLLPLLLLLSAVVAQAQWLNYPTPGTPRTPDGKPNLTAPAPRALDGHPDLSGAWHVHPTSLEEFKRVLGPDVVEKSDRSRILGMELDTISKYAANILADYKPDEVSMRPAAMEIFRRRASGGEEDPGGKCLPIGIPGAGLVSEAVKFVQSPRELVIFYESDGTHRQIYTDGRELLKEFEQPSWLGYSAGKWERDTLVVESAGFNDRGWIDLGGHPRSEAMHMTERFRRRDFGHLDVEMTFDDPVMYTKPFSAKFSYDLLPASDVFETICNENEKDHAHRVVK